MTDFLFLSSKIPANGDCSHEIKKTVDSWRERDDKPGQCIEKQKHYSADKICIVKCSCMVVKAVLVKKAECQKLDAFELCCLRKLLKVPWTARRSNQSILREIDPEHSLEGLILKLKLQYSGHLM